jgi:hypothetical protein
MHFRRRVFRFYGRFAAAYGTAWLAMLLAAVVTQSHINAGAYGFYGFLAIALFYAIIRALTDAKLGKDTTEAKPRFSLRGLFVVITFVALLLGWWKDHSRLAIVSATEEGILLPELRARMDAPIGYRPEVGFSSSSFGEFYYVSELELPQVTITDQQIAPLAAHLGAFPHLWPVVIGQNPSLSPAQQAKLEAALPNLVFVDVLTESSGDGGPERIVEFPNRVCPKGWDSRAAR